MNARPPTKSATFNLNELTPTQRALEAFCKEYAYAGHGPLWYFKTCMLMVYRRIIDSRGLVGERLVAVT